jgi:hypothetical protein
LNVIPKALDAKDFLRDADIFKKVFDNYEVVK